MVRSARAGVDLVAAALIHALENLRDSVRLSVIALPGQFRPDLCHGGMPEEPGFQDEGDRPADVVPCRKDAARRHPVKHIQDLSRKIVPGVLYVCQFDEPFEDTMRAGKTKIATS